MFGSTQQLTAAQLTALQSELNTDPQALGYSSYVAGPDLTDLAKILNFLREGVTACPIAVFPASNVVGNVTKAITGATQATPIVITSAGHGLTTNQGVVVSGVGGNTAANGTWIVTVIDANTFSLNASQGNAAYTSGGVWVQAARNPTVKTVDVAAAVQGTDLITNAGASAATADQFGKIQLFGFLINQPSGLVTMTNPDGSDTNTIKSLRQAFNANSASRAAINALANRNASRAEILLGLSGSVSTQMVNNAPFQFSNLIDPLDVQAAIKGHY